MFLLAYPFEHIRCSDAVLFIQNIVDKDNINAEKILFKSKLKPKVFFPLTEIYAF